jgi:type II secretory pathway pseudopilin PulG
MNKYSSVKNIGYTLLETLIVISISVIVFSLVFANYRDFSRRQILEEVAKLVVSDIRLAQEYALAGRKEAGCVTLTGYEFERFSTGGYRINDVCTSGGGTEIKSVSLPADFQISSFSPAPSRFTFGVLARGTNRDADVTFTLTQTSTGRTKSITVSKIGNITIN